MRKKVFCLISALVLILGLLPGAVLAADNDETPATYTVTGLPTENAMVTVNGEPVTVSGGTITVKAGDEVKVTPDENFSINEFRRVPDPVIILSYPEDIWNDGTGYQMVIDADATAYDEYMSTDPMYFTSFYSDYHDFEYLIPTDADPGLAPQHFVYCGSESIAVPAGTYDFFILVPGTGGVVTSTSQGNASGKTDNASFDNGNIYEYTVTAYDDYSDRVDLKITENEPEDYGIANEDGSYSFTMPAQDLELFVTLEEDPPPTGDSVPVALYGCLAVLSMTSLAAFILKRKTPGDH